MTKHSGLSFGLFLAATAAAACNTTRSDNQLPPVTPPGATVVQTGPQPTFKVTANLDVSPPPISGGTLAMAPDGHTLIASDPDRDRIYVVDIPSRTVKFDIPLATGSEPGRVAVDAHGSAHVALRGSGGLASINLTDGTKTEQALCAAPRGIAYDSDVDALYVACSEGLLKTIPLDGTPVTTLGLDGDLRDVLVRKGEIFISHFRSAQVDVITRAGTLSRTSTTGGNLGWRMAAPPTNSDSDDVALVSQDPVNEQPLKDTAGAYGSGGSVDQGFSTACNSPTITTTRLDIPGQAKIQIPPAVLPVDLATNGHEYAIVAAGNGHTPTLPQIFVHTVKTTATSSSSSGSSGSFADQGDFSDSADSSPDCLLLKQGFVPGQAIAAVFDGDDQLIVQSREPAALYIMSADRRSVFKEITLNTESKEDGGHAIFHSNSGGFIACASCHAEGGEDGRVWNFAEEGQRRTPSMRGTIANTAPYHWDGTMKDINDIVDHVFVTRMSGPKLDSAHVTTLQNWLFKIPAPPKLNKPVDSVARGAKLFESQGCVTCHSGAHFTNNTTLDVGTGAKFQVPSLIGVGWRAPFLHNGCAKTLKDRFDGSCGGGDKHGNTDGLKPADITDLTTYLESL